MSERRLESALTEGERLGRIRSTELSEILARGPGWKGIAKLRRVVDAWNPESLNTESELEKLFLRLCTEFDVPIPAFNAVVEGLRVDCFWRERGLIVELDGYRTHRGRLSFERDRSRDLRLSSAGFEVHRLTDRMVHQDPEAVASMIRDKLAFRP